MVSPTNNKPLVHIDAELRAAPHPRTRSLKKGSVAGVPFTASLERFNDVKTSYHASALNTLMWRFGKLERHQFEALHAAFGGKSQVRFDAAHAYTAVDFLPPALQAALHKDLDRSDPVEVPNSLRIRTPDERPRMSNLRIGLHWNCHGFAWEAMRAFAGAATNAFTVHFGDPILMQGQADAFPNIGTVAAGAPAAALDQLVTGLVPGDLVQFHNESGSLLHSLVCVGPGLFAEKPNTEGADRHDPDHYQFQDETPTRLCTLAMSLATVRAVAGGPLEVRALRPNQPLAPGVEVFASELSPQLEKLAERRHRAGVGVPLVTEFDTNSFGGILQVHANAVRTFAVALDALGRGTVAP